MKRLIFISFFLLLSFMCLAQGSKISDLPAAATLTGTEYYPAIQFNGVKYINVKVRGDSVADFAERNLLKVDSLSIVSPDSLYTWNGGVGSFIGIMGGGGVQFSDTNISIDTYSQRDSAIAANVSPPIVVSDSAWSLKGNSGTNPATDFVGTTDVALHLRSNSKDNIVIDSQNDTYQFFDSTGATEWIHAEPSSGVYEFGPPLTPNRSAIHLSPPNKRIRIFADSTVVYGDLLVTDTIKLPTGAGSGKVLTSDASGNASWQQNTYGWDTIYYAAANDTTTSLTLVNTSLVTPTLPNGAMYEMEAVMEVASSTTAGMKFAINITGSGTCTGYVMGTTSATAATGANLVINTADNTNYITTAAGIGTVTMKGVFNTGTSSVFAIQFQKTTSGTATINRYSILKIKRLN